MVDIQKLQQKMDEALQAPYFVNRLDQFKNLQTEIELALDVHKRAEGRVPPNEGGKIFFVGIGITVAATTAAAFAIGILALPVAVGGLFFSAFAADTYPKSEKVKTKAANKYQQKHGEEIKALKHLARQVDQQQKAEIESIRNMSAEEKAGVLKLEDLAGRYPEIREALIQDFRQSVSPVFEKGGPQARQQPPAQAQNLEVNEPEAGPV